MYNNPAKFQNIQQLAEEVGFSCSHFQQIYKKEFGISCYEDLLTARIKTAQYRKKAIFPYVSDSTPQIH